MATSSNPKEGGIHGHVLLADRPFDRKPVHDIFPDDWKSPSTAAFYDLLIAGEGTQALRPRLFSTGARHHRERPAPDT